MSTVPATTKPRPDPSTVSSVPRRGRRSRQEARLARLPRARRDELPPDLDVDLAAKVLTRAMGGVVSATLLREPELVNSPAFVDALLRIVESDLRGPRT